MEPFIRSNDKSLKSNKLSEISRILVYIIVVGLIIRLVLAPFNFSYDLSFFVITSSGFESGRTLYEAGNFYYPPVYGYFLSTMTYFWNLLPFQSGSITDILVIGNGVSDFSKVYVSSMAMSFMYKVPLTLLDLACSWMLYSMVKEKTGDQKKANLAFALFFLSPLVIWTSSVTCMFESLAVFFTILSIYALIKDQYILSGAMMALAFSTKVFPIILGFAIITYIIVKCEGNIREILKRTGFYVVGLVVMILIIMLPLVLNGELSDSFKFFSDRSGGSVSGATESIADFFTSPTPDKLMHAFPVILLLIAIFSMLCFLRDGDNDKKLVMACTISLSVFFLWPPIPTYPVVAIAFIALAATYCGRKEWLIPWILFSCLMVLHHTLVFGNSILHTLANETALFDIGNLIVGYLQFLPMAWEIQYWTLLALYIPGISAIVAIVISLRHNEKEAEI